MIPFRFVLPVALAVLISAPLAEALVETYKLRSGGVLEVEVLERTPAVVWRTADGLFLLDQLGRGATRGGAAAGVVIGVLVILWMTFSPRLPEGSALRSPFHSSLIIVLGTLVIFFAGVAVSRFASREDVRD